MPTYRNQSNSPSAPYANVVFRATDGSAKLENIQMLLDTGADISVVPLPVLTHLGASVTPGKSIEIESYDGTKTYVHVAILTMEFCNLLFTGQFIALNQSEGIIGRDVLNRLNVNFNGPSLTWDILSIQSS